MSVKTFAAASAAAALLWGTSACAMSPEVGSGPAEVSVEKSAPAPVAGGQATLERLDRDELPGADELPWGGSDENTWLPQAESALRGLGDSDETTGSLYLRVPADYAVTSAALVKNQPPADVEGEKVSVTRSKDPVGTVVDLTVKGTYYVLSASPDPQNRKGFSVVLVQWSPAPDNETAPDSSPPASAGTPTTRPTAADETGARS